MSDPLAVSIAGIPIREIFRIGRELTLKDVKQRKGFPRAYEQFQFDKILVAPDRTAIDGWGWMRDVPNGWSGSHFRPLACCANRLSKQRNGTG